MDSTVSGQIPNLSSNASFTASSCSEGVNSQSTSPGGTAVKIVSEVATPPLSITTFEESPECPICREEICLNKRNISQPEITYCKSLHTHHQKCIDDFYTRNPDQKAPHKNPDSKCFICSNPMPLRMPRWDGEAFICPIRKSELDALTPYVGAPMTFSLADFPMIGAQEVTVALGFKGAPVIRLLDTSQRPQAENPTRGDYVFCLSDQIITIPRDPISAKKTSVHKIITDYLTFVVRILSGGSDAIFQDYLQVIHESLQKLLDADENTRPFQMMINDSNNKNVLTFAINYPIYPLEWCKPVTQRMVCLENKEGTSCSRPILSSDSAQFEEPLPISENRTGQSMEENTPSQLDRLSFELSVTAPESKDSLAFFNNMNFSDSRSIRSVFDNDRSPSHDLLDSPQYAKFKTDFQNAISNMDGDGELRVRVKLKKLSDSTKNQDAGPPPAEPPLGEITQHLLSEVLSTLSIIRKFSNTDPN
ncbi:hypothetical protein J7438_16490 [Thalassotalea sp. G20_0]|uniref:hypothetical protein n=1 Tax=Thalassotalea sp. G20_0 TaxID=2821093 RepID=UPI001ADC0238|nr:hypothetical protein [Thalassotalea sp. G20_0]MBO9495676.1 hypothetical protein [Thalassotalea sp. G20_0]